MLLWTCSVRGNLPRYLFCFGHTPIHLSDSWTGWTIGIRFLKTCRADGFRTFQPVLRFDSVRSTVRNAPSPSPKQWSVLLWDSGRIASPKSTTGKATQLLCLFFEIDWSWILLFWFTNTNSLQFSIVACTKVNLQKRPVRPCRDSFLGLAPGCCCHTLKRGDVKVNPWLKVYVLDEIIKHIWYL